MPDAAVSVTVELAAGMAAIVLVLFAAEVPVGSTVEVTATLAPEPLTTDTGKGAEAETGFAVAGLPESSSKRTKD